MQWPAAYIFTKASTLSWRRSQSYRNQSIDLLLVSVWSANQWTGFYMICISMDWFLYDLQINGLVFIWSANQWTGIYMICKSINWFLHDRYLCHEKFNFIIVFLGFSQSVLEKLFSEHPQHMQNWCNLKVLRKCVMAVITLVATFLSFLFILF